MRDYDFIPFRELEELASHGDEEAVTRWDIIRRRIRDLKRYAEWAMTGEKADGHNEYHKRYAGRRMLELLLPPGQLFHPAKRAAIYSFLINNFTDENRPDWIDLIAPAVFLCMNDDELCGGFTIAYMYQNLLREGKQKRRGLLNAAIANEVEKSLFGGKTQSAYTNKKEFPQSNIDHIKRREYVEKPQLKKRDMLRESSEIEGERNAEKTLTELRETIKELNLSPEDKELIFSEHGEIELIALRRGVKPGTLRQRKNRIVEKIRQRMM